MLIPIKKTSCNLYDAADTIVDIIYRTEPYHERKDANANDKVSECSLRVLLHYHQE